jgi:exopolyphosphatase/guanosine-5'-triphosphate,3'-diphosphate pyrophosphatase
LIYGAIDIGTNAARLLIGEVTENNGHFYVKKISYTRVPLRLGLEVFTDGIISDYKRTQFVKTMQAFQLIADVYEVKDMRACATSAMREAENGLQIKQQILEETGVNIDIIDGEEEASIIFSTFLLLAFDKESPFIVIDVGGGSTEISVFEEGKRIAGKSLKIGTIRMLKGKVATTIWDEIDEWITTSIDINMPHKVFATGGNINKLHKLLGKVTLEPISYDELDAIYKDLSAKSLEDRIVDYQLKPDRADVIVPACEIYEYILRKLDASEVFVPKIGLSDGMIYEMHRNRMNKPD